MAHQSTVQIQTPESDRGSLGYEPGRLTLSDMHGQTHDYLNYTIHFTLNEDLKLILNKTLAVLTDTAVKNCHYQEGFCVLLRMTV